MRRGAGVRVRSRNAMTLNGSRYHGNVGQVIGVMVSITIQ